MGAGTVVVVGLGPAGASLLVPAALEVLRNTPHRYARTQRHPCVADLAATGIEFVHLDHHYEQAGSLASAYDAIADELVTAACEHGRIAYAVPGSPVTAERTLALLRERGVAVETVPGLSFTELAWAAVGVDPMASAALVADGRAFCFSPVPMLIAQCDHVHVLSDVKLALLDALGPDHPVTVLQSLGTPTAAVTIVALADLDRVVEPDHLTTLYVDGRGAVASGPGAAVARFVELVERLRGPGGCPWDAEQTHRSLTRHLLEESYEVIEAIEELPPWAPGPPPAGEALAIGVYDHLEEELGDLLFQVVFHATLAREAGAFTLAEVADGIHDKLVRRHPHVFGDVEVTGAEHVVRNWERIKQEEKGRESLMDGIPGDLPSLLFAHKLLRKAAAGGVDFGDAGAAWERLRALVVSGDASETAIGELLAAVAMLARAAGVDAEAALRGWGAALRARFARLEGLARDRNIALDAADPDVVSQLWAQAANATS